MNKKQIKSQPSISMGKFLRLYCQIDNDVVINMLSSLSHKEVKKVCKDAYNIELQTLPFEDVEQEDVGIGEVIFVSDSCGNPAPYKNPYITYEEYLEQNNILVAYDKTCENKQYIKRRK